MNKYYSGTGRRKTAIASVRISSGKGVYKFKGKEEEIKDAGFLETALLPLKEVEQINKFDATFIIHGGGKSAQKDAALLAVAKAVSKIDEAYEKTLKKSGYLTRDSREKERKKPGLKRARRAPQWAKR